MSTSGQDAVEFCPDSGSGPSILKRSASSKYFPDVPIQTVNGDQLKLKGVLPGRSNCADFVNLPVKLVIREGDTVQLRGEVRVIDQSPIDCILGNSFLCPNGIDVLNTQKNAQMSKPACPATGAGHGNGQTASKSNQSDGQGGDHNQGGPRAQYPGQNERTSELTKRVSPRTK